MIDTPPEYPRLRLDFYDTAVIMTQTDEAGRITSHPVAVQDVVSACTEVTLASGFLPPHTLFWKQQAQTTTLGVYVPARYWQVRTEKKRYQIPMPPLVFVGRGRSYSIYAVKKRPSVPHTPLFHLPAPNVFDTGNICVGNTPFPACSARTLDQALTLFWEGSNFNSHLSQKKCNSYPRDVRQLWRQLDGKKRFPLSELVPMKKNLHSLM